MFSTLLTIASAPILTAADFKPLPIEVTPEGRYMAADIAARCPLCKDDLAFCCCPETHAALQTQNRAEMAAKQAGEPTGYRALGLADRLADDLRAERYDR